MKILSKIKLAKIFTKVFWTWFVLCLGTIVFIILILSFDKELPKIPFGSAPIWLNFVYVLGLLAIGGGSRIGRFEYSGRTNATARQYKLMIAGMTGIFILLLVAIMIVSKFSKPGKSLTASPACETIAKKPALFNYPLTTALDKYVIESTDSINITDLRCEEFAGKRMAVTKELMEKCDVKLKMGGYYSSGKKISKYLADGDTNQIVLMELIKAKFFLINESVYPAKMAYYYKVTVCIAKDNSVDSLIDLALAKYCMRWTFRDMVVKPLQTATTITVSLPDIIQEVCIHCPNNKVVEQIKVMCNGVYDCDSIYFRSGKYQLSDVSKLILESFFNELQKSNKVKFVVDFYGYTDPHKVTGNITYDGGGSTTDLCVLLPDPGTSSKPIGIITRNEELSFARAYSCYHFLKEQFPDKNILYRYTGCGVSDINAIDLRQRTVKIIITKK